MKEKIRETPPSIEKLVELEDYINTLPTDIDKINKNI